MSHGKSVSPSGLPSLLSRWFARHQRDLPWRKNCDPYRVWISEIMLQQTQVDTVIPYYERFLKRFPTLETLAAASQEEVLKQWSGLGYYSRARNLHKAARVIAGQHGGRIPDDYSALRALPGIGEYTAGAVLSIAFNRPFPVVDGNVRRVLSRIFGWKEEQPKRLWQTAREFVEHGEPRIINQALMELGATVCSTRAPRCLICPVHSPCVARKKGIEEEIPAVTKRPRPVHVHYFAIVAKRGGKVLMRPVNGFWEFPTFNELPSGSFMKVGSCRHTVTHHRLDVTVCTGPLSATDGSRWVRFEQKPVSALTRKVFGVAAKPLTRPSA